MIKKIIFLALLPLCFSAQAMDDARTLPDRFVRVTKAMTKGLAHGCTIIVGGVLACDLSRRLFGKPAECSVPLPIVLIGLGNGFAMVNKLIFGKNKPIQNIESQLRDVDRRLTALENQNQRGG